MKIDIRDTFNCTLEAFWACFDDAAFDEGLRQGNQATKEVLSDTTTDGIQKLHQRFTVHMPQMPSAMRKVLKSDTLSYEQFTTVDRAKGDVTWKVVPSVMADRVTAGGTYTVRVVPDGVERAVQGEVKVAMPFVGGSIEKMIVGALTKAYEQGTVARRAWIAARAS